MEVYGVTGLGGEWLGSEAFPMRTELNLVWWNSNPECNNAGSVFSNSAVYGSELKEAFRYGVFENAGSCSAVTFV